MKCKWCEDEAFRKQGRIWLCKKHYRFQQIRATAKRRNKSFPSYEWLEAKWVETKGNCPVCSRKLNWMSAEGTTTVVTLQHDRNGENRLLCLSCNVRHASFKDDSFYSKDPTKKTCPRCKLSLPLTEYAFDRSGRWLDKKNYCRKCSNEYHREWVDKNREKYNAKKRKYYHKRIADGNPIPR